ncbi:MAG: hypothetical protein RLZZ04_972 [Cyanobacteriota bacterium]|jgi:hypothetical protein
MTNNLMTNIVSRCPPKSTKISLILLIILTFLSNVYRAN